MPLDPLGPIIGPFGRLAEKIIEWLQSKGKQRSDQEFQERFLEAKFERARLLEQERARGSRELEEIRFQNQLALDGQAQLRQAQMLTAQHQHETFLESLKAAKQSAQVISTDNTLFERLELEALFLTEMGYDVIYEPIGDIYGLALPISQHVSTVRIKSSKTAT